MKDVNTIKVWDPVVRLFHWGLVAAFTIAFVTEEDFLAVHVFAGYTLLLLLGVRMVWGIVGTKHARFSDFVYQPKTALRYLKDTVLFKAKRYLGHNPAGGVMVLIMLISLFLTGFTGLAVYAAQDHAGPLAAWFSPHAGFTGKALEEVHEFSANFTLALVFVHILGVLVESFIHRENLISAMITGFKPKDTQTD